LTSFKSFDSEVPSFYFGSMPSFVHKISCKSASIISTLDDMLNAFCSLIAVE